MSHPSQIEGADDMLIFFVLSPVESDACVERVEPRLVYDGYLWLWDSAQMGTILCSVVTEN